MLSTDTIFSHSDARNTAWEISGQQYDSVCPLEKADTEIIEICPVERSYLPQIPLKTNENVLGNLIFTIVFLMVFAFVRLRGKDLLPNLLNILVKKKSRGNPKRRHFFQSGLLCALVDTLLLCYFNRDHLSFIGQF